MKRLFFILLACLFLPLVYTPTYADEPAKYITTHIIEYVDRPVGLPQYFPDKTIAQDWLDTNNLPFVIYADERGIINFDSPRIDPRYDCDDYAKELQYRGFSDGWIINECPVFNGYIWGIKVSNHMGIHVGNFVRIGNTYYYIESTPDNNSFKLKRLVDLD